MSHLPSVRIVKPAYAVPEAVSARLMRALVRGIRDFYQAFNAGDGPSAPSISAVAAHSSVRDPEVLKKVGMHTVDPNGAFEAATLDADEDRYVQTGEQTQRVDLSTHIDRGPLDAALPRWARSKACRLRRSREHRHSPSSLPPSCAVWWTAFRSHKRCTSRRSLASRMCWRMVRASAPTSPRPSAPTSSRCTACSACWPASGSCESLTIRRLR